MHNAQTCRLNIDLDTTPSSDIWCQHDGITPGIWWRDWPQARCAAVCHFSNRIGSIHFCINCAHRHFGSIESEKEHLAKCKKDRTFDVGGDNHQHHIPLTICPEVRGLHQSTARLRSHHRLSVLCEIAIEGGEYAVSPSSSEIGPGNGCRTEKEVVRTNFTENHCGMAHILDHREYLRWTGMFFIDISVFCLIVDL